MKFTCGCHDRAIRVRQLIETLLDDETNEPISVELEVTARRALIPEDCLEFCEWDFLFTFLIFCVNGEMCSCRSYPLSDHLEVESWSFCLVQHHTGWVHCWHSMEECYHRYFLSYFHLIKLLSLTLMFLQFSVWFLENMADGAVIGTCVICDENLQAFLEIRTKIMRQNQSFSGCNFENIWRIINLFNWIQN